MNLTNQQGDNQQGVHRSVADSKDSNYYTYRDFSRIPPDNGESEAFPATLLSVGDKDKHMLTIRVQKFPVKLYAILTRPEFADIITWMPHGRSWKVLKPDAFEYEVMSRCFEYSNYHSFNRLINAWSFRRISSGPDRGTYYHELFLRGLPHLLNHMRRLPKTNKKLPMKKQDEPDFNTISQRLPLPDMQQNTRNYSSSFTAASAATKPPNTLAPLHTALINDQLMAQLQYRVAVSNASAAFAAGTILHADLTESRRTNRNSVSLANSLLDFARNEINLMGWQHAKMMEEEERYIAALVLLIAQKQLAGDRF